jgi:hypothetical protein
MCQLAKLHKIAPLKLCKMSPLAVYILMGRKILYRIKQLLKL